MKRRFISLFLILLMVSVFPLPISADEIGTNKSIFADVSESHAAYAEITALAEQGVLSGKSDGLFYPEDTLKREEFAKMLFAALNLTKGDNLPIFYDVPAGSWYADYVLNAASSGLIYGVSDTEFGVGQEITRQDMAVIMQRYLVENGVEPIQNTTVLYADDAEISDYAKEAVKHVSSLGIMTSRENNLWCPKSPATRAEAAKAIYTSLDAKRIQAASLGRYGAREQYGPPYETITDDRLAESMPPLFDVNTWPKVILAEEDLEDSDYGRLVLEKTRDAEIITGDGVGYESDSCVLVSDGGVASFAYKADPDELFACDFVAFTCMVKGEDIQTTTKRGFRPIVQVYDDAGTWLGEDGNHGVTTDTDWVEVTNIVEIPEELNDLSVPEFYTIKLSCNGGNTTGKMYFDNLRLSKIRFEPMNVVFMDPVYKGIIKGDGGIGDISLRAFINDGNGSYDFSKMNFTARITDEDHNVLLESTSKTVTSVIDAHFSSDTIPMGTYWAECILTYKDTGEVVDQQEYGIYKREADYTTVMDIDEYGRIVRKGEPYFPITIYNYGGYWDALVFSDAVDSIHQSRTLYQNFATRVPKPEKDPQEFIQNLDEQGKTVTLNTGQLAFGTLVNSEIIEWFSKQSDARAYIKRLTDNFKDMDTLGYYYIWDEANALRHGREEGWINKLFTHYDPDHPTTSAISNSWLSYPGIYSKMTDIVGYDPYLVTGKDDQDISLVAEEVEEGKALNPNRPIQIFPQGFAYTNRGDIRGPHYDEFKNMCFQAVIAGACGLHMYCYGDLTRYGTHEEGRTPAEAWADYEQVFREIQYLEPIIISMLPAPYYEVQGGGEWLDTMTKRYEGKSYLFTVNTARGDKTASIYLDGATKIKGMYSGKEYTADQNGYFNIKWGEYETEVFEYEQPDYKSSHADFRNFVAANYSVINAGDYGVKPAEVDTPTIVIDDGATEMDYRAYISDYAQLYINGEAVPTVGTLNIDSVDKLDLTIVSEDGRSTTEKTYLLQRD